MSRETEMLNFSVVEENRGRETEDGNDPVQFFSILIPLLQLTTNPLVLLSPFSYSISGTENSFSKMFQKFSMENIDFLVLYLNLSDNSHANICH